VRWWRPTRPRSAAASSVRLLRERGGVGLAGREGREHRAARDAEDVGRDRAELDVGAFERLLDALHRSRALAQELGAVAHDLAQLALRAVGDEARLDEPMLQQLRDPLRVLDVGLAARDGLDVLGVDHEELETGRLEEVVRRLPVHARGLHRDMRDGLPQEPVREGKEVGGHRPEGARLATVGGDDARGDALLVDIEAAAALVEDAHGPPPAGCSRSGRWADPLLRVSPACSHRGGATIRGAAGPPAQVCSRARNTKLARASPPTGAQTFSLFVAPPCGMTGLFENPRILYGEGPVMSFYL